MDQKSQKTLNISKETPLLDSLRKNKIPIPFSCGGEGICTTCRIVLKKGQLTPKTTLEHKHSQERHYTPEERLSCQCKPLSNEITILIP